MRLMSIALASVLPLFLASLPGCPPDSPNTGFDCNNPTQFPSGRVVEVENATPGAYIVVYKDRTDIQPAMQMAGVTVTHTYERGFAATIARQALNQILNDPNVAFVQQDGVKSINEVANSWGLDRIDQREGTDGDYSPGADGAGVNVAIIDTGVTDVPDFEGRLNVTDCFTAHSGSCEDGHGHGTHVTGTVGGKKWGVAKKANLYIARVLSSSGSGSDSQVIAGINWVAAKKRTNPEQAWVANMSLGGSPAPALDQAVCDALADGVVFAIAAGNENKDAVTSSPARVIQALTVGAIERFADRRASFSNYGPLIDLFAPGTEIESDQPGGGTAIFQGTSMASPHVAGVAALYLQRHPATTPAEVATGLIDSSTKDKVFDPGAGSPNRIPYVKE